jgi:lysozyme family protein|nr:MAG TPA: Lysozyme [Caudoviricetes sp.]
MAKIELLVHKILQWEGGFANHPNDKGGATNKGVTLSTWKKVGYDKDGDGCIDVSDLKLLTDEDVEKKVLKPFYWDRWKADDINNQSIANLLVDWVWASGVYGIKYPQEVLGVIADGIVGNKTLSAVNDYPNQEELFQKLWDRRKQHFESIVHRDPSQKVFLKGWMNRLNDYKFE